MIHGAGTPFGLELCRQALSRGDDVVATHTGLEDVRPLLELVSVHMAHGTGIFKKNVIKVYVVNPEDSTSLATAVQDIGAAHSSIDVLIHCAGGTREGDSSATWDDVSSRELMSTFINQVTAPMAVTQGFMVLLTASQHPMGAKILFLTTSTKDLPLGCGIPSHCASRAALNTAIQGYAQEVPDVGFYLVCPSHEIMASTMEEVAAGLVVVSDRLTLESSGQFVEC